MSLKEIKDKHNRTEYVQFDSRKCIACWKCQTACEKHVIGKVDFFFHKHARLVNSEACIGCLKCVKVCEPHALSKIQH